MEKYIVKYCALKDIIGCALLSQELEFTGKLTKLILTEFVSKLKAEANSFVGSDIDKLIDPNNFVFDLEEKSEDIHGGVNIKSNNLDIRFNIKSDVSQGEIDYELQTTEKNYLPARETYYLMRLGNDAYSRGEEYSSKHFTISIWLFGTSKKNKSYMNVYSLKDGQNNVLPYCHIIEIDLTKLETCDNLELKKYLNFFIEKDLNDYAQGGDEILQKATIRVVGLNGDERILREIDAEEKRKFNYALDLEAAKEDGITIGLEKGEAILKPSLEFTSISSLSFAFFFSRSAIKTQ